MRRAEMDLWLVALCVGAMGALPVVNMYYPVPSALQVWAYPALGALAIWRFDRALDRLIHRYTGR